jgi:hypothetical protein
MSAVGPYSLFLITAVAHVAIGGYSMFRSRQRAAIPAGDRDAYTNMPSANSQMITPESMSMANPTETPSETDDPAVNYG